MLKSLWTYIFILQLATPAGASEFIQNYKAENYPTYHKPQPVVEAKPVIKPAPAVVETKPVITPNPIVVETKPVITKPDPIVVKPDPVPEKVIPGNTDFNDYMPITDDPPDNSVDSSEVVNGGDEEITAPIPIPKPKPKPKPEPEVVVKPDEVKPAQTALYDLQGCNYGESCWNNSTSDRIKAHMKKIISNVALVNSLHKIKIDARYLLCTGWRESTYNPGARGSRGEKGMFQVMADTASASLKKGGPPLIEEFKNYRSNSSTYLTKMANSTLAQTEMSVMVLKTKIKEAKGRGINLDSILTGNASVATYKKLAHAYNGLGASERVYAQPIANCLSCLRASDGLPDLSKDFNYTSVDGCLAKAKQ